MTVEAGEVQAHEQGAGLDIGDLVCEEVRDGFGDLVGRGRVWVAQWPKPCEQWLDVDVRALLDEEEVFSGRLHVLLLLLLLSLLGTGWAPVEEGLRMGEVNALCVPKTSIEHQKPPKIKRWRVAWELTHFGPEDKTEL